MDAEFNELVRPVIEYLNRKHDPLTSVYITNTNATLLSSELGYVTKDFIKD